MQAGYWELEAEAGSSPPTEIESLNLLTLNIAHGRGVRAHQLFLGDETIKGHLREIAKLLERERVDIAAFQECDLSSFWNSGMNQLEYMSRVIPDFGFGATAKHMQGPKLSYGTSILSQHTLQDIMAYRFIDNLPFPRKGFLAATLSWPGEESFSFLVLSVHLDFLRFRTRNSQIEQITEVIRERDLPCIVMGDFNCTWQDSDSALKRLSYAFHLHTYHPEDKTLTTFCFRQKRWDWILLSQEFAFADHKILPERVSDHHAVWARIVRVT